MVTGIRVTNHVPWTNYCIHIMNSYDKQRSIWTFNLGYPGSEHIDHCQQNVNKNGGQKI